MSNTLKQHPARNSIPVEMIKIEAISVVSEEVSASTEESAAAAQEQAASMEQINNIAQNMLINAEKLQKQFDKIQIWKV